MKLWWQFYAKIDLHKNYVDNIILVSDSGKPMMRESDLIDVWFDSGASSFAVLRRDLENLSLPADLYFEGSDQHRGWFQASPNRVDWM